MKTAFVIYKLGRLSEPGCQPALQAVLQSRQAGSGQRCKIDVHVVLQNT